jgi:hypothetical protein
VSWLSYVGGGAIILVIGGVIVVSRARIASRQAEWVIEQDRASEATSKTASASSTQASGETDQPALGEKRNGDGS